MIQDFINLLFPNYCFTCKGILVKGELYLCTKCSYYLPKTNIHKQAENHLIQRFGGLLPIEHLFPYLKFSKGGSVQKIIERLKYKDCPEIGEMLGRWYGAELKEQGMDRAFDLILPVPLHLSKVRKRGYNQSDFFAQGLSTALGIAWNPDILCRKVKSKTQTKKGRTERFENVAGIFEVVDNEAVRNKRILLVDDVLTTGATLTACGVPVLQAGCASLSVAVLAVTQ